LRGFESEDHALIALNRLTQAYSRLGTKLLQRFDSVSHFFAEYQPDEIELPPRLKDQLHLPHTDVIKREIEADLKWLDLPGHSLISIFDQRYPALLKEIDDPPLCLYASGNPDLLNRDQVAIVGSRKPTQLGLKIAKQFASELSRLGIVITSGLAYGIDASAHTGALQESGETIAVMGCGCDLIYPRSHERLAMRVGEKGIIVSEFPLRTRVQKRNFPQRNRLVTGLSLGTLVVEAAVKSGSLVSAYLALDQNREVYAVPGSIFSTQSVGCHQLIRDGAKLTESVSDILEELPGYVILPPDSADDEPSSEKRKILEQLSASPISPDELHEITGIPINQLVSLLINLEIEGHIVGNQGGYVLAKRQSS